MPSLIIYGIIYRKTPKKWITYTNIYLKERGYLVIINTTNFLSFIVLIITTLI